MCEKDIQEKIPRLCLIEQIKWPKEVKDSSSLHKAEIINSESPSIITKGRWSSRAKEMARTAANASTSFEEDGNLVFSNMEAITLPWWSRTTTPSPTSSVSRNTAPSKLIFKLVDSGPAVLARHLTAFLGPVGPEQMFEGSVRLKEPLERVGKAWCWSEVCYNRTKSSIPE